MLNITEEWKQIKDFPNYEISNTGKIRNQNKKELKPFNQNNGYVQVQLYKDSFNKRFLVHRLVAKAFIPNNENKKYVNHIDGNKHNNCITNLEWVTNSENILHARRTGLNPYNKPTLGKKLGGQRKGSSKYYGVCWDKSRNKWKASIVFEGKPHNQKRFNTEEEAGIYYNELVHQYKLEFTHPLNVIKCPTTSH